MLGIDFDASVFALDWFTGDGPEGRLVLHQLTVPQAAAEGIGLAYADFTGIDKVVAAAETVGFFLSGGYQDACFRGPDPKIAASLGIPDAPNLWTAFRVTLAQRLGEDRRQVSSTPLFLEWAYTL